MNGIQEVSSSILLSSTKESRSNSGFFYFKETSLKVGGYAALRRRSLMER
jgi:hypothetical protein